MQKIFCGHPVPWRSWYNGCIHFVLDADQKVVMTHSNTELVNAIIKLSEEEFTGE